MDQIMKFSCVGTLSALPATLLERILESCHSRYLLLISKTFYMFSTLRSKYRASRIGVEYRKPENVSIYLHKKYRQDPIAYRIYTEVYPNNIDKLWCMAGNLKLLIKHWLPTNAQSYFVIACITGNKLIIKYLFRYYPTFPFQLYSDESDYYNFISDKFLDIIFMEMLYYSVPPITILSNVLKAKCRYDNLRKSIPPATQYIYDNQEVLYSEYDKLLLFCMYRSSMVVL